MKKNDCTRRGLLGLLLALCMTLLLLTPALAGVTNVTGGSGHTVKTTVVNEYTDKHDKKTFDLKKGDNTFTDAARFFGSEQGILTVTFPDLKTPVALTYRVTEDTVVMTAVNYDGLPDGTYTCPQREDKTMMKTTYDGSKLTYLGNDYEDGKVVINETRTDYYTRNHIWRGYTLTVTGNGNGNSSGTGNGNTTGTGSGGTSGTGLSGATGGYNSPKTFDPGMTLYAVSAMLSGAGLTVLRSRKR